MTEALLTLDAQAALRKLTVQGAVAAVMDDLPNIGKADRSPEGYSYRGIEAVTKHVQPLFAKHGVVIAPKATITDVRPSPAMKDGWTDVYMQVEWTITGPDGSTITAQTTGIGRDRADKGANKAQTQAFKYLLLHMLCIADGKDDADSHTYDDDRQEDVVVCSRCQEAVAGARSDKEPMRAHLVAAHGWVRQEDGTVVAPAELPPNGGDEDGTRTGLVPSSIPNKETIGSVRGRTTNG
jgi:hypothetical protein